MHSTPVRLLWNCTVCGGPLFYTAGRPRKVCATCRPPWQRRVRAEHPCAHCGNPTTRPKFCSRPCLDNDKHARRDALKRSSTIAGEVFGVIEIANRDGWVCHLCGEPIDPNASRNSDWGLSLDHLIPLSAGGEHRRDNAAIAHRWCNSVRGVKTVSDAQDLLAIA